MRARAAVVGAAIAGALAVAACGGGGAPVEKGAEQLAPPADAIAKVSELGPVKATLKVWPAKPALGDSIYARVEIESPAGVRIEAPFQEAGDQRLGRFKVIAFDRGTEHKPGGGQVQTQTYTLEAYSSGRHRIPPLRFEMIDARSGAASAGSASAGSAGSAAADPKSRPQELLTEEVSLEVQPVAAATVGADLKGTRSTLDPEVGGVSKLVILGLASLALVLVSGGILLYRALSTRRRIQLQRSAYDEAVSALRALEDRGAPDSAAADGWFVELSAIVRRYLEQRYEIRAPELTTEEFLLVATARPELGEENRGLLSSFLERCDRVKFAGYRPDAEESLATLAAARGFIEDTRLRLAEAA